MNKGISLLMALVMSVSALFCFPFNFYASEMETNTYIAEVKSSADLDVLPDVLLKQTKINYLEQTISVSNVDNLLSSGINYFTVTAQMNYKDVVTQSIIQDITLEQGKTDYTFVYPTYGKFTTTLEFKNAYKTVCTLESNIGIIAEEYNFAPLNASFPVIYFTLAIQDASVNENGDPVPGFVFLERDDAYEWDSLCENLYPLPYATQEQLHNGRTYYVEMCDIMVDFIKDLYEISPQSKFNLYTVDNYSENIPKMILANGIPDEQWRAYLLSDGSGSYSIFNSTFNSDNSQAIYDEMANEWHRIKNLIAEDKAYRNDMLEKYVGSLGYTCQIYEKYAYVIAKEEPNVEWWLARVNDTLISPDTEFLEGVKAQSTSDDGCIKVKNMNSMLTELQNKGDSAVNQFKSMYKFNDSMFSDANVQNKKVMLILGTRVDSETNFDDYAKFVMDYYGDEYAYYYKGHPATPTGLYPEKQEQLDKLGIQDVESSVAAELILFFYPDIYLCGYRSSTFISVESDEMACSLFNSAKGSNISDSYHDIMDSFVTKINPADEYYNDYIKYCTNENNSYYLVEYNNNDKYVASIYNATDRTFTNLKYELVPLYQYEIINNNDVLETGESNAVNLPVLTSTQTESFVGWTDGEIIYPGGASIMISADTVFSAVWKDILPVSNTNNIATSAVQETSSQDNVTSPTATTTTTTTTSTTTTEAKPAGAKKVDGVWVNTKYKKPTISMLTKAKKSFKVTWKKVSSVSGYQIQYSTSKKFTKKTTKSVTVKGNNSKKPSKTIKSLKSKKTYYVRVRTYKTVKVNGKSVKVYSSWSKVKAVKTK